MQEKLWTKNYLLNLVNNLLIFIVFYLFMIYTTKFAMTSFNATVSEAGLAAGLFIISALLARLFAGRYMDFIGRKRLLLYAVIFYALTTFWYHFIFDMGFLYVIRFTQGLAYGVLSTIIATVIVSTVPASRRGEGLGYFSLSITLASAIGPFLGIILPQINALYVLLLGDVLCICVVIMTYIIKIPEIKIGFRQRVEVKSLRLRTFIEPTAIPIAIVALLGAIGYSAIMSYIGAYSEAINLLLGGSLFYVAYSLTCLLFRPVSGIILDKYGNNVVMIPILFAMIFGFLAVAIAHSTMMLLIGAVLIGIGYGTIPSAGQAIAVQKVKINRYSMATATLYMALDAGNGVGPYLLGMIVPVYGFRAIYVCSAIAAAMAFLFYCFMAYRNYQKAKSIK